MTAVLALDGLTVALPAGADRTLALDDVSFDLRPGEVFCLVGESGSGKSMAAAAILGLLPPGLRRTAGRVLLDGRDIAGLPDAALRPVRGARIGMIFQEPMTALNPLRRIGDQIAEMFRTHTDLAGRDIAARVDALLADVQLPAGLARAWPHELSGGQRQRAMIAMALALEPAVLIADEPTTALDVTTQARILGLIRDLQRRRGTAVLFITHDFGVVADIADRVAVMQHGRIVEQGRADDVLNRPGHPYTRALIRAVPSLLPPAPRPDGAGPPILTADGVTKVWRGRGLRPRVTQALRDVTLHLRRGGTLGIVGESGSGKSTLARCLVRLVAADTGRIHLDGQAFGVGDPRIQMVFQDPFGSLNPRRRAGDLVMQGPRLHGVGMAEARARAVELFGLVGLNPAALDRYPHEFSGGQRQRIALARALALRPGVLVADEPVSALDVSVQAQVLDLLAGLRDQLGLSLVFITHDLRVAARICDRIAVMKDGQVVEEGPAATLFADPRHPYTRALLDAVPGRGWKPPGVV